MIKSKGEFFLSVAEVGIHPKNIMSNLFRGNVIFFEVKSDKKEKLEVLRANLGLEMTNDIDKLDGCYNLNVSCEVENILTEEDIKKIDKAIAFSC